MNGGAAPPLARARRSGRRSIRLLVAPVAVLVVAACLTPAAIAATVAHAGYLPPANPPANVASNPPIDNFTCTYGSGAAMRCTSPCTHRLKVVYNDSRACVAGALHAIDYARRSEHVRAMVLPTNWYHLTIAEQLFVVADLERVDRGLPPYVGLVRVLDAAALAGARHSEDPSYFTSQVHSYGANWAGNSFTPLSADYGWMYADGWGKPHWNFTCTSAHAPGCWGHRDNILGANTGVRCADCVMGAGFVSPAALGWSTSYAEIFVAPTTPGAFRPYFTWARNVAPFLPPGRRG